MQHAAQCSTEHRGETFQVVPKARQQGVIGRTARALGRAACLAACSAAWSTACLLSLFCIDGRVGFAQGTAPPNSVSQPAAGAPHLAIPIVHTSKVPSTPQTDTTVHGTAPSNGTSTIQPSSAVAAPSSEPTDAAPKVAEEPALKTTVWQWQGLMVTAIDFEGVTFAADDPIAMKVREQVGRALDPNTVRQSLRTLFRTGRYRDIGLKGVRQGDKVKLIFTGPAQMFVGRVSIEGVKEERLTSLLEYATNLNPGTPFTATMVAAGNRLILQSLAENGYYEPMVQAQSSTDPEHQQVNVAYTVTIGPQARVGTVQLTGKDPGLSVAQFRKDGKLKQNAKVTRDTTSNALSRLRVQYQKQNRLEATVALEKSTYDKESRRVDYAFQANQGPLVEVVIEGAKVSKGKLHQLVPVFEEGTVDNDLLNEGSYNIREYLQRQGYFDAKVEVRVVGEDTPNERIVYSVDRGNMHKVLSVTLKGNKYFDTDVLKDRMQVAKADAFLSSGRYSASLLEADVDSIEALYRANGFSAVAIKTNVTDVDVLPDGKHLKISQLRVALTIDEGVQQKFGTVDLVGVDTLRRAAVKALLNAQTGQPYSLITLSGDRDAMLNYYLSQGFEEAHVTITQAKESKDPARTDVALNVVEGQQVFIKDVLLSGDKRTKPKVIAADVKVHPGDPLDQTALLDTQRSLYNLALFNEVNTAVQNPDGGAVRKNVLVQLTEARRWDVTYGFGFEVQTGTPAQGQISEASIIQLGLNPNQSYKQNGVTGISPRVSLDVSRINLFGTDKSITLNSDYGLLEKVFTLSFNNPHLLGHRSLNAAISGGYSNVQDISTFQASTLQGDIRVTQIFRRKDTFIYDFEYRRVAVNPNSLQVSANLIPVLSEPVRVGGPGLTWFHDTREPSPLNATKGSYTSVTEFLASSKFGSQTDFNRLDASNSTYYSFGKRKYVLARNTRIGFENVFGKNPNASNSVCAGVLLTTNASCDAVPLPERLYAGGANSHRGFPINGAGPRDLQTGFPVGGTAVLVNSTELRMPPPTLPYVGDSVSFVLFHDMGNVFQNGKDLFPSFLRVKQKDAQTCAIVTGSIGTCNFNYYSHAVGLGVRYTTPVGPLRADFSYNLNPPVYPVIYDFSNNPPYEGQGNHFNFFFSIGQSF